MNLQRNPSSRATSPKPNREKVDVRDYLISRSPKIPFLQSKGSPRRSHNRRRVPARAQKSRKTWRGCLNWAISNWTRRWSNQPSGDPRPDTTDCPRPRRRRRRCRVYSRRRTLRGLRQNIRENRVDSCRHGNGDCLSLIKVIEMAKSKWFYIDQLGGISL